MTFPKLASPECPFRQVLYSFATWRSRNSESIENLIGFHVHDGVDCRNWVGIIRIPQDLYCIYLLFWKLRKLISPVVFYDLQSHTTASRNSEHPNGVSSFRGPIREKGTGITSSPVFITCP